MAGDVLNSLSALQSTPVPNLLIVAGLVFLLLGFVGNIGATITLPPYRQRFAAATGIILLVIGIILFLLPPSRAAPRDDTSVVRLASPMPPLPEPTRSEVRVRPDTKPAPAPAYQTPEEEEEEHAPKPTKIILHNSCDDDIHVAIHYYNDDDDEWDTEGWWTVQSGDDFDPDISITNRTFYVYAHTAQNTRLWSGDPDDKHTYHGYIVHNKFKRIGHNALTGRDKELVDFRRENVADGGVSHTQRFTCE